MLGGVDIGDGGGEAYRRRFVPSDERNAAGCEDLLSDYCCNQVRQGEEQDGGTQVQKL